MYDAAVRRMYKAITSFIAALVLFCAIAYGLWDLFRGASLLVGVVALIFVAAGAFNTWAAFNSNTGERNHDASKIGGGLGGSLGGSLLRGKR
jgi:hypothetical protein